MLIKRGRNSLVVPGCCGNSIKSRVVHLEYVNLDDDGKPKDYTKEKPVWVVPNLPSELFGVNLQFYNEKLMQVKFCPYCGEKLPEIELDPDCKLKIYTDADGGYYCGTCNERNMNCECYSPTVMWKVKE